MDFPPKNKFVTKQALLAGDIGSKECVNEQSWSLYSDLLPHSNEYKYHVISNHYWGVSTRAV